VLVVRRASVHVRLMVLVLFVCEGVGEG
jgi:hypothetical protein